jgi:hypothetical protein
MTQSLAVKSVPAAMSAVCSVVKPGAIDGAISENSAGLQSFGEN